MGTKIYIEKRKIGDESIGIRLESGYEIDGLKEGVWQTFDAKSGALFQEDSYKNGFLHGTYKEYDEKGNLVHEGTMKNDKHVGPWISYHDHGSIEKGTFSNDGSQTEVGVREKYMEGKLYEKRIFSNSEQNFIDEFYHPTGKVIAQVKFVENCPVKVIKGPCWNKLKEFPYDLFYYYAIPDPSEFPELYGDD